MLFHLGWCFYTILSFVFGVCVFCFLKVKVAPLNELSFIII